ncbi:MAG: DUF4398 domain-containing protein [Deltaproteobacteria bacterium]|nr:DUF4398 domain-containing protein [Deltaproteobacteria bacterium]
MLLVVLAGCGSYPVPVDALAGAQASTRAAQEVGASTNPRASLHLKLAQEQFDEAKRLIADGDNQKAEGLLQRANADAELALALAKEATMQAKAKQVLEELQAAKKGSR